MNEELIRSLVRETIARQLGTPGAFAAGQPNPDAPLQPASFLTHGSHYRYAVPKPGDACVIEPAVRCNHCGYCESHGH
jgi:hypothetical protein